MAKKTLGFGSRIISTHTRNIDNKRADERPVGGGIVVPERSGISFQRWRLWKEERKRGKQPDRRHSAPATTLAFIYPPVKLEDAFALARSDNLEYGWVDLGRSTLAPALPPGYLSGTAWASTPISYKLALGRGQALFLLFYNLHFTPFLSYFEPHHKQIQLGDAPPER